ncbi:hypothetical protein [Sporomusa sp. KB1]|jgi:hypothetical protein|uniref:hypothetical protein n=1 Tax=Sporomusa sp. KB1 TaxID=943346 RepID=UPI00119CD53D|nr:hypothetical protein [Sporomusa sp. KB1]TWH46276.1 hypothetical protein Salpa_2251 [Sporomusa sp. KB1]
MSYLRRYKLVLAILFILCISVPAVASPLTEGNIISFSDVNVKPDEHVKSILVVGGNANIAGYVGDEVVVINGNVFLSSTANIKGHVIVLGGKISAEDGAVVREGYFQYGGGFFAISSLLTAGLIVTIIWFAQFIVTVALLIVPILTIWLRQSLIGEISQIVKDHKIKTLFLGILGIIAGLVIIAIFSLSVIGIPMALVLVFLMLVVMALGLGAICSSIGDNISSYLNVKGQKKYLGILSGSLLIALLFNIPLIGLLVLCLVVSVGFGGVLLKLFTKKVTADNS